MFQLALILAATVALGVHGQTSNYSALCPDHTMDQYPDVGPSCSPLLTSGVSKADIKMILNKHNDQRNLVAIGRETRGLPGPQPSAADMLKMAWDDELATVAQRWADQCTYSNDECRSVERFPNVGQNIYKTMTSAAVSVANWADATTSWFDEVTQFNKHDVYPFMSRRHTAQYSQAAWGETYLVGCGFAQFKTSAVPLLTQSIYVCNYAPGGNIQGGMMYQPGTKCSKCPAGMKCSPGAGASGLCK